jgi:tetratricopeptide (TPR) repeat protein
LELTENMVNQPGKEVLFAHYASNLLKRGELDEALKICEKGLKKFPTYAQAHYILARCYIHKKLNDEARAELERVLRYEPNHIRAIRDLAGLHFANGFQDLYKDYLMQLFTLEPMNEKVIEEAKKLGEYKLWSSVPSPQSPPEPDKPSEFELPAAETFNEKHDVFIESEKDTTEKEESDPIFPDKIDLSQFDNVEDDFTTILHGKMDFPRQVSHPPSDSAPDLADVARDIIEEPEAEDSITTTEQVSEMKSPVKSPAQANTTAELNADQNPESKKATVDKEGDVKTSPVDEGSSDNSESTEESIKKVETEQDEQSDDPNSLEEFGDEEDDKFEQPKIISQTLGEILVSQQKYVEAKAVFEALKEKQPDNKALDLKIEYLERIIGLEKEGKS